MGDPVGWGLDQWGRGPWGSPAAPLGGGAGDLDLSYEESDGAGGAVAWTITAVDTFWEIAAYGLADHDDESFESGWGAQPYETDWGQVDSAPALYSGHFYTPPRPFDGFEAGWDNTPYFTTSATFEAALFGEGRRSHDDEQGPVEDFEINWGNSPYYDDWSEVTAVAATYDGGAHSFESFEHGWANDTYDTTWAAITSAAASYSGLWADAAETFERVLFQQPITVDLSGDWTPAPPLGHGLGLDTRVQLSLTPGGVMPDGFAPGVLYYVVSAGPVFQLGLAVGGAAIVPTITGSGVLFEAPAEYWGTEMVSP